MKNFIVPNGLFEISIPETWYYQNDASEIYCFTDYINFSTFQISFQLLDQQSSQRIKELFQKLKSIKIGERVFYIFPVNPDKEYNITGWIGKLGDYLITITFTYHKTSKYSNDTNFSQNLVYSLIRTIKLISPKDRDSRLSGYLLGQFLKGLLASVDLLNKSIENKSFIQAVIIFANQIDALLRMGIILKLQLENKNTEIDMKYLYQGDEDKIISEKEIYNHAMKIGVIDKLTNDFLFDLYRKRNQVVHRYIISDITTAQVETIARKYYDLKEMVRKKIILIENEQIEKGIGMTVKGNPDIKKQTNDFVKTWLIEKHGQKNYFDNN